MGNYFCVPECKKCGISRNYYNNGPITKSCQVHEYNPRTGECVRGCKYGNCYHNFS